MEQTIDLTHYIIVGSSVAMIIAIVGIWITLKLVDRAERRSQKAEAAPSQAAASNDFTYEEAPGDSQAPFLQPPKMCRVVFYKKGKPTPIYQWDLTQSVLTIGRAEEKSDWAIAGDATISARHCQLAMILDDVYISDLNSTNGTFLNEKKITYPTKLQDGAKLSIGKQTYQVAIDKN
jgi:hypothetical protein